MKIFILALVAVSVGLSESKARETLSPDDPRDKSYTSAQALEKYFNIKSKDLEACKNEQNLEENANVTATLTALSQSNQSDTPTKPEDFQQILKNIVKAALPCADDKKVTKHVTYYNDKGSKKV